MGGYVRQGKRLLIVALACCACAMAPSRRNVYVTVNASSPPARRSPAICARLDFHHGPFYLLSTFQLSDIGYDSSFYVPTADRQSGFRFGVQAPTRLYIVPSKKTSTRSMFVRS